MILLVTLPACSSSRTKTPRPSQDIGALARAKIPEQQRPARPPVFAQIVGAEAGWESLDERELLRLKQSGVNTVFVTASGGRSGVYFKTDWAPVIRDALSPLVAGAHRQGMQVWASASVRRMDWIDPALQWSDWRFVPQTGRMDRADSLDVMHPAFRDYLVGYFSDLAASGVDGILLAADPASAPTEGFSTHALRRYEKDSGQVADPTRLLPATGRYAPEFWRWVGWKQREQLKVVIGVMDAVRALYPALKIAVEVHPEALTNPQAALAAYAEDLFDLRRYRVDFIALGGVPAQGPAMARAAEIVRGERLLVLSDPDDKASVKSAMLPDGAAILYRQRASSRP